MRFEKEEEILRTQFANAEPGSEEQKRIMENLAKIEEINQREIKDGVGFEEVSAKIDALEAETKLKEEESKRRRTGEIVHWIIDGVAVGVSIVGGCILPWKAYKGAMHFEENGTFSSRSDQKINGIFRLFKR